jgi:hypothetical protein
MISSSLRLAVLAGAAAFATVLASAQSGSAPAGQPTPASAPARTPVLVELFTSEGCSSCPPADQVLARLVAEQPVPGAEIIALGFHVDYWDQLGWVDRFSSRSATFRQNSYSTVWRESQVYTPQMVVDGARQFVGHDWRAATQAIAESLSAPRARVTVRGAAADAARPNGQGPSLQIDVAPLEQAAAKAEVWLAITEDGLVSDVRRGENARRQLPHIAVVRTFDRIGSAARAKGFTATRTVSLDRDWRRDALKAVVVVQDGRTRRIVGVAAHRLE